MNGKKKLLLVNNNVEIGGIQKALVNLLYELDKRKICDFDLFLFSRTGAYIPDIPASIKVIEGNKLVKVLGVSQNDSKNIGLLYYLLRGLAAFYAKKISRVLPIKLILSTQRKMKNYDIVISFMHNPDCHSIYGGCNEFVLDRVIAKKKITFVHCDFLNYGGNNQLNQSLYSRFDAIAAVSNGTRENFIAANPNFKNKTFTILNCHNYDAIRRKALEHPVLYAKSNFNVVTVSRLGAEKGILRTINVIDRFVAKNEKIIWHIIGSGPFESEVKAIIQQKEIKNNVILYGFQENPYRFMANADLFLLPSFHEAAPMVFDEAKCLGLPILTTVTTSAVEMVADCGAGWVCENTEDGIYNGLKEILDHKNVLNQVREHLEELYFDNAIPMEQFRRIL